MSTIKIKQYILLSIIITFLGCDEKKERWSTTVRCLDIIAMPNEYRLDTGFDSIQFMCRPDGSDLSVNFCYPNIYNKYRWHGDIIIDHGDNTPENLTKLRLQSRRLDSLKQNK